MKTCLKLALGWTLLAMWTTPVLAADKIVAEEGAVEVMLLRQQSIQKELKLTTQEIEKIHKFAAQQWEKAQKVSKLGADEQDREFDKLSEENDRFVEQTLTKEQSKRLHEIVLQVAGLLFVTRDDIATKLKLTADQKQRVEQMRKTARQEAEDILYATKKEQQREKLKELRETSRKRLLELLTDDQELAWQKMTGEPFKGDLGFFDTAQAGE